MRWESTFIRSSSVFNDTRFPHKVHKCTEQTPTCCKIRSDFSLLFVQHPFMRFKQLKYIVSVQTANFVAMKFILCVSVPGAVQCAVRTVAHALLSIPADRCKDATNVVCVFFPIAEEIVKQNCRLTNKLLRQNIRRSNDMNMCFSHSCEFISNPKEEYHSFHHSIWFTPGIGAEDTLDEFHESDEFAVKSSSTRRLTSAINQTFFSHNFN